MACTVFGKKLKNLKTTTRTNVSDPPLDVRVDSLVIGAGQLKLDCQETKMADKRVSADEI
jgi:hypothetical protein